METTKTFLPELCFSLETLDPGEFGAQVLRLANDQIVIEFRPFDYTGNPTATVRQSSLDQAAGRFGLAGGSLLKMGFQPREKTVYAVSLAYSTGLASTKFTVFNRAGDTLYDKTYPGNDYFDLVFKGPDIGAIHAKPGSELVLLAVCVDLQPV